MRHILLAGTALLFASPALGQEAEAVQPTEADGSPIDTLVAEDSAVAESASAPTGDPILDRLNALEARVKQLEARNAQLEQEAELNQGRLEAVETRAAKAAQFQWTPTI